MVVLHILVLRNVRIFSQMEDQNNKLVMLYDQCERKSGTQMFCKICSCLFVCYPPELLLSIICISIVSCCCWRLLIHSMYVCMYFYCCTETCTQTSLSSKKKKKIQIFCCVNSFVRTLINAN